MLCDDICHHFFIAIIIVSRSLTAGYLCCQSQNHNKSKKIIMKNINKVEVILFSKYSLGNPRQKELVRWLGTTLQSAIARQENLSRKLFLRTLKDSPAIYMS